MRIKNSEVSKLTQAITDGLAKRISKVKHVIVDVDLDVDVYSGSGPVAASKSAVATAIGSFAIDHEFSPEFPKVFDVVAILHEDGGATASLQLVDGDLTVLAHGGTVEECISNAVDQFSKTIKSKYAEVWEEAEKMRQRKSKRAAEQTPTPVEEALELTDSGLEKLRTWTREFVQEFAKSAREAGFELSGSAVMRIVDKALSVEIPTIPKPTYLLAFATAGDNQEIYINVAAYTSDPASSNLSPVYSSRYLTKDQFMESAGNLVRELKEYVQTELIALTAFDLKLAPNSLVPNAKYEKLWNQAKAIAEKTYGKPGKGVSDSKFWGTVVKIYVGKIISEGMKIPFEVESESLKQYIQKVRSEKKKKKKRK